MGTRNLTCVVRNGKFVVAQSVSGTSIRKGRERQSSNLSSPK
jgi:hypothetical protein